MNPYFVLAPNWSNVSGGGALLHSFAVHLRRLGMNVFISADKQNPVWERLPTLDMFKGDRKEVIAVYPEVVHGNPYGCGHTARYMLHLAGFFGGQKTFDATDMMFTHSDVFNHRIGLPKERVIKMPYLNTDIFYDKKLHRSKVFHYKNKGIGHFPNAKIANVPALGTGFDFDGREGQERLSDILNQTKVLYCYDNITAMVDLARLCGCAVVLIPDPFWKEEEIRSFDGWDKGGIGYGLAEESHALKTINSKAMREYYNNEFEETAFNDLKRFVEITQRQSGGLDRADGEVVKFELRRNISFKGEALNIGKHTMDRKKFYSFWFVKDLIKDHTIKIIEDKHKNNGVNKPIQWAYRGTPEYKQGKPLVSICCLTYNHENIIRDALNGFVMQRTNFPFEIVVCDDASTDKTPQIILEYAERYKGLFKPVLLTENQFSKNKDFILPFATHLFPAAQGKYIAECDGDDYWTDCYKLQKQFDFLEVHPEFSMCYNDLVIYYSDTDIVEKGYRQRPKDFTAKELAGFEYSGQWLHPSTKMWRNYFNDKTRRDFEICAGDNATNVHMSLYGGCGYVEGISPSVFRRNHGNNAWSCLSEEKTKKETANLFKRLYEFMKTKNKEFAEIRFNIWKGYQT